MFSKWYKSYGGKRCPPFYPFAERFWSKVNVVNDNECWDWLGAKIQTGYGSLTIAKHESRKEAIAHRISWILSFGAIHGKLEVGHKCANRKCVNPAHLYLTTRLENNREVKFRGEYNYPNQVNREDLSYA
jgi:HNH endonuclease